MTNTAVNMEKKYRIFISYRGESQGEGNTIGKKFAGKLYDYLISDPFFEEKYGNVYFSPEEEIAENYKMTIPRVMEHVECFVIPLNKTFFSDFRRQGKHSITYMEITEALKNPYMHFVVVELESFDKQAELEKIRNINLCFKKDADRLIHCKLIKYDKNNEQKTVQLVGEQLIKNNYRIRSVKEFMKAPNVRLEFKRDTESLTDYPFYERMYDVKKVMLMNFAATSFLVGSSVARVYNSGRYFTKGFQSRLLSGDVQIEAVLTNPYSAAAIDAELYKMYPSGMSVDRSEIIIRNLNKFYDLKKVDTLGTQMNVYLTDIALPYGMMITEHENPENNHMKIDLYAPLPGEDKYRPSFYLMENNPETKELYSFFKFNFFRIAQENSYMYQGHPDVSWLSDKRIIHRAQITKDVLPHTRDAFSLCIQNKATIEVDLIVLKDHKIVVGRKEQLAEWMGCREGEVSNMTWLELREKIESKGYISARQIMFLNEFLDYIHGRIPVLLEVKSDDYEETSKQNVGLVNRLVEIVQKYIRQHISINSSGRIAIHSANSCILKMIRKKNCMIPIGQISLDFSKGRYSGVPSEVKKHHKEKKYFDDVIPDFMTYAIEDVENEEIEAECKKYGIPLIGWTVKDKNMQQYAERFCNNIIIEGAESYI